MKAKNILATLIFLVPMWAMASKEVGNGGGAIVCRNTATKKIDRAELLDLFEARTLRDLQPDLGDPNEDFHTKIDRTLAHLSRVSPLRARKYAQIYQTFFAETVFVRDVDLIYIPDAEAIAIPHGCAIEQEAIQKAPEFLGDKRYTINANIWDVLDGNSKAALVLHEILYREGLYWGHENSKAVRYMTGIISSTQLQTLTNAAFADLIFAAQFHAADLFGTLVIKQNLETGYVYADDDSSFFKDMRPTSTTYESMMLEAPFTLWFAKSDNHLTLAKGVKSFDKGAIKIATTRRMELSFLPGKKLSKLEGGPITATFNDWTLTAGKETRLEFDDQERPSKYYGWIQTSNPSRSYTSPRVFVDPHGGSDTAPSRSISSSGVILRGYVTPAQTLPTPQGPLVFDSLDNKGRMPTKIIFTEDGLVKKGRIAPLQKLRTTDGDVVTDGYWKIEFTANGVAVVISKGEGH